MFAVTVIMRMAATAVLVGMVVFCCNVVVFVVGFAAIVAMHTSRYGVSAVGVVRSHRICRALICTSKQEASLMRQQIRNCCFSRMEVVSDIGKSMCAHNGHHHFFINR